MPGTVPTYIPARPTKNAVASTSAPESAAQQPHDADAPYPGAPKCTTHANTKFHTLWNPEEHCYYDHEHGENPFTPAMDRAFGGLSLRSLLGDVEIGHTNPSGPMENTHKHGGFKWQVQSATPNGCALGFEGAQVAVNATAIQYHAFGDYSVEFDSRIHSALALMRQCLPGSQDYGYVYTVQHVDYGQRVSGYQGDVIPYPDTPNPGYADGLAPYFTIDCIGRTSPPCGRYATYEQYKAAGGNTSTTWTSKSNHRIVPSGSPLFTLLFRARDTYQILDWNDTRHPFTFLWMCSSDGGATYGAAPGCRYNNTTTRVHEIGGTIPAAWDNLAGFDSDSRAGRISATGYTTKFGIRNPSCTRPGPNCHPLKLVGAYVGRYGSFLIRNKIPAFNREALPERDVYFCSGRPCSETSPGARSSGWIGPAN
jgi:hypothetical protein